MVMNFKVIGEGVSEFRYAEGREDEEKIYENSGFDIGQDKRFKFPPLYDVTENTEDIYVFERPSEPEKIRCDAYDYEKGIASAVNSFRGEYMVNYSWAEFKTGTYVAMDQDRL